MEEESRKPAASDLRRDVLIKRTSLHAAQFAQLIKYTCKAPFRRRQQPITLIIQAIISPELSLHIQIKYFFSWKGYKTQERSCCVFFVLFLFFTAVIDHWTYILGVNPDSWVLMASRATWSISLKLRSTAVNRGGLNINAAAARSIQPLTGSNWMLNHQLHLDISASEKQRRVLKKKNVTITITSRLEMLLSQRNVCLECEDLSILILLDFLGGRVQQFLQEIMQWRKT